MAQECKKGGKCSAKKLEDPRHAKIPNGWILSFDMTTISRHYVLQNWSAAMDFLQAISTNAEVMNHHPDLHLTNYRELQIDLTTQSAKGLTSLDLELAQAINELPVRLSPKWKQKCSETLNNLAVRLDEDPVSFDSKHYPNGLNGDFLVDGALEKFYNSGDGLFENPELRDIACAKENIVKALQIVPGMVVADVGAGSGLMEPLLSKSVGGTGTVLVSELSPVFCKIIQERCKDMDNVEILDNPTTRNPNLPNDGSVDLVLLLDVYHHLEHPRSILWCIYDALHRNGVLIVIDFHRDPAFIQSHDAAWVYEHLRADQKTYETEIENAGFVKIQQLDIPRLSENYCLVFRKRPLDLSEPGDGWTA